MRLWLKAKNLSLSLCVSTPFVRVPHNTEGSHSGKGILFEPLTETKTKKKSVLLELTSNKRLDIHTFLF